MKTLNLLFVLLLSLLPICIFAYSNETYSPSAITLSPYQIAKVTVTGSNLNIPLTFSQDYQMSIKMTTDSSETQFNYFYPYQKIAASLPYFKFRLFNFGSNDLTFNITFNCIKRLSNGTEDFCDLTKISRVFTVQTLLPSKAIFGTTDVFAIVLTSSLLSKVALPINLYQQTQEAFIDFMTPEFYNGFNYSTLPTQTYDEQVYDSSYWNNVDTLTMPWIPFFTHCTDQDKRLLLYDILENSPDSCTYKEPDQIKTIENIPTTGFVPDTDSCDLKYTCYHVQTGKGKSYGSPWYSVTGTKTLYYIYRNPITIESMINLKSNQNDASFQNLINENSDAMIPVNFRTADSTPQTGVPLQVEMKISFFQESKVERNIISVEVIMSDYAGSINEGGLPYSLRITYEALDYFGMINSFRVGFVVYFFVFVFVSIVILLGAWLIWRINKFLFSHKKKIHPTIKFFATFKLTFVPQFTGAFFATISTILTFSLIAKYFQQFIDFADFTPNFLLTSIDTAAQLGGDRGRIGLACLFFSMFVLNKGMSLLIPIPTKEETKVIVKNLAKKGGSNKQTNTSFSSNSSKSASNDSASSLLEGKNSDKESDEDSSDSESDKEGSGKIDGSSIILGLKRKQNHVMLICILASITLLFIIEPSGATSNDETATSASTLLMVLLMIVDVVVILLLKHFLLKEILLLAPITTAFEIVQFVLVMRADTFVMFVLSYLLRTLLIVVFRIYLDPVLKNLEFYIQKVSQWVLRKSGRINVDTSHAKDLLRWRNVELILNHSVKHKGHYSTESIVFILVNYTTKQCARLMFPIYLLFLYVFPNENQITNLLGINQRELVYYIAFWAFLMIPSFIMDVYILNILEIVHGHKLFDYLSFCEYRFNFRTTKWIASSRQMDRSVSPEYRSIHNFCFSQQFYFTITVTTWGILLFMSGMFIIYANEYKPFSDSLLVPMLFIVLGIFLALKFIFSKISAYIDIWRQPRKVFKEPSKRVEEEKKRLESHLEVDKIIKTNFFRLLFVRENKDWIINNLKNFIQSENFHDNEGYLLRIYQRLTDEEVREGNERKRKEFIKQKKYEHMSQLTLKDLKFATEEDLNGKTESHSNIQEEKIPRVKKSIVKPLTYLLYHWFYFAKQNRYLLNLVADIDNSKISNQCFKCGQEYALKLVPQKPLTDLLNKYRIAYAGLPFNKYEWKKFYDREQQFKTFCDDCKFIDFMKKRKNVRTKSRTSSRLNTTSELNKSSDPRDNQDHSGQQFDPFESPEPELEEKRKIDVDPALKKFLLALHLAAKAKVLHKEKKPIKLNKENRIRKRRTGTQENNLSLQNLSFDDAGAASGEENGEENEEQEGNVPMLAAMRNFKQKSKGFESARA